MRPIWVIFTIFVHFLYIESINGDTRVAIIGAGIGGSSAAYYLLKNRNVSVDIYEKRSRVGGRVFSQEIFNKTTDLGASFLIEENELINSLIKDLNVTVKIAEDDSNMSLGIFKNKSILLTLGNSDIINMLKVVWRYGFLSPLRANKLIKDQLLKFKNVYHLINSKNTSNSLHEFLMKTEMDTLFTTNIGEFLKQNGVSDKYIDEIYNAVIAGIYNQHKEVNSYAGLVALIGSGSTPLNIVGGNDHLIKKIIESNQSTKKFNLFLNSSIIEIERTNNNLFYITDSQGIQREYEVVIIACPLKYTNITFKNIVIQEKNYYPHNFVAPYQAFVKGTPRPEYFNWRTFDVLPKTLISTDKHIGKVIQMSWYKDDVFRLISESELDEESIEKLGYFNKGSKVIYKHHWEFAYPAFEKYQGNLTNLPDFVIEDNLYYINAIESAASCMELSIISARNIVNIIEKKLDIFYN